MYIDDSRLTSTIIRLDDMVVTRDECELNGYSNRVHGCERAQAYDDARREFVFWQRSGLCFSKESYCSSLGVQQSQYCVNMSQSDLSIGTGCKFSIVLRILESCIVG
jgi:hypothetical protein